ncbi:MAG: hypothetical protein CMH54_07295 [Myxococcales bacterium]|nr:hypothetical protein [Myxococcales bacterium]
MFVGMRLWYTFFLFLLLLADSAAAGQKLDTGQLEQFRADTVPLFTDQTGGIALTEWSAGKYIDCGKSFEKIAKRSKKGLESSAAWFRAGRCYERAHAFSRAEAVYARVAKTKGPLSDLARLRLAVVYHEHKKPDQALKALSKLLKHKVLGRRARRFRARVLEAAGRHTDLVTRYRGTTDSSTRFKVAMSQLAKGQTKEATESFRFVFRKTGSSSMRKQARKELQQLDPKCFTGTDYRLPCFKPSERLELAEALFAAHKSKQVLAVLEPRLSAFDRLDKSVRCRALFLVARSYDKLRNRKPGLRYYKKGRRHCKGEDVEPDFLFFGGVSAYREDQLRTALSSFRHLHNRWPKHSYNDDAVLYEAYSYEDMGRHTRADNLLKDAIWRYRDGDMQPEVGWRYVWSALSKNRKKEALRRIRYVRKKTRPDTGYRGRGRLAYWEARLREQLGQKTKAIRGYRDVLREARLSFYSLLAYERLAQRLGEKEAKKALDGALLDPPAALAAVDPREKKKGSRRMSDEAFTSITVLVRMGLFQEAQKQLAVLGDAVAPENLLLLADLADRAQAHQLSVHVLRRLLSNFHDLPVSGEAMTIWRMAYPKGFEKEVEAQAGAGGIDPFLIWALMREESGFSPDIESWANAIGLMQLLPSTARRMAAKDPPFQMTEDSLRDPAVNIRLGVRYLQTLKGLFAHKALMVAGYNAGEGRVKTWLRKYRRHGLDMFIERIPFRQTRGYTKRVLESWFRYSLLYGGSPSRLAWKLPKMKKSKKRRRSKGRKR